MLDWNSILYYKDGQLFWKESRRTNARKDKRAGHAKKDGYRDIRAFNRVVKEHRVVWEMINGPIPEGLVIDHINGNRSDNRIENLRLLTPQENSWNRKIHSTSTTQVKNVYWDSKRKKYRASLRLGPGVRLRSPYYSEIAQAELWLEEKTKLRNFS